MLNLLEFHDNLDLYFINRGNEMVRIKFATDQDRIQGNYLLATHSIVRRLRGQVFEIAEHDLKLLDEHEIHYHLITGLFTSRSHTMVH